MRLALVMFALLVASTAHAQGADLLETAEHAYGEVDFEGARHDASAAIDAGGLSPTQLVRAYQLIGVSSSALGEAPEARAAFVMMVSIDPDVRLDDTVPPRLRAPFLEARGTVSSAARLSAEVQLARAYGSLRIVLTDPRELVDRVRIHARVEGQTEFTMAEFPPTDEIMSRTNGASSADRIEYWLEGLDLHGNQVLLLGSEFEPLVVGRTAAGDASSGGSGGGDAPSGGGGGGGNIFEQPLFWIIVGGVVLVGAAIGVGFAVDSQSHVGLSTSVRFGF